MIDFLIFNLEIVRRRNFFLWEVIRNVTNLMKTSITPTILTVFPFTLIIAFHGISALKLFGAEHLLPGATVVVAMREVIPVISAFILTAQISTIISSKIALQRLKGEFDVLEVMGINPKDFVIVPLILSSTINSLFIFILSSFLSIVALYYYFTQLGIGGFWESISQIIDVKDVLGGAIKSTVFGFVIGDISAYFGYTAELSPEGVGKSSSKSVIFSAISFIILNVILTKILFL